MRLCSASEMTAVDRQAIDQRGIPGVVLMENAGRACCDHLLKQYGHHFPGPVLVLCGRGNNGGDGYVIARNLRDAGWQVVTIILAREQEICGDAAVMLGILRQLNQPLYFTPDVTTLEASLAGFSPVLIVDAILGTGLKSSLKPLASAAIHWINQTPSAVFAVDIPSGVNASTGQIHGSAVQANLTVTFDTAKIGHASRPGADCCGRLVVVDIGIPRTERTPFSSQVRLLEEDEARGLLPLRSGTGHKGTFGHLLVVAGSCGKSGAAALAADAGIRSGCGLVTAAVPAAIHDIIEVKLTEAMSVALPDCDGFIAQQALELVCELAQSRQAMVLGPGFGTGREQEQLLLKLLPRVKHPVLIDADGITLLAGNLNCLNHCQADIILTPHPGEMSRLCGLSVAEIESDRFNVATSFARRYGLVLVLKGARTVVAAPDGRVFINSSGNDGLATGGSGDVLSGLIGGLLAQGLDIFSAAALGVWLHGRCADLIAVQQGPAGMIASDLLKVLPSARDALNKR